MNNILRHDSYCRVCKSSRVVTVLKLSDTPLEDQFLRKPQPQDKFPLELALCEDCGYLYLPYIVSPEASYHDYLYVSSVTEGLRTHYDDYAREIVNQYKIGQNALAVDLGSNDGSMLSSFRRMGMRVQGVEPARSAAQSANNAGFPTICDYFSEQAVKRIIKDNGKAALVTANYMYANIDDIHNFTHLVASLLDHDGLFVVQTGYHPEQMKINMFDYIYHEHFSYFTVEVLDRLFAECGLKLIDAVKTSPKGGSLRVTAQLDGGIREISPSVSSMITEERESGMRNPETYRIFGERILDAKDKVISLLSRIHSSGKGVVGFGASHSTTTLIHQFGLSRYIKYIIDDNEVKHGTYSPGEHIPVFSPEKLLDDPPSYILILAWQHKDAIIEKHRHLLENGGQFIVPLPDLVQIQANNR